MTRAAHVLEPSDSDDVPGLLEKFLSDIAVDEYADAPTRDVLSGQRADRASTWIGLVVAALVGLVIAGALLNTRLSTDERLATRSVLAERVHSLSAAVASRQSAVDQQAAEVQALQDQLLAASDAGPARAAAIASLSTQTGTEQLFGPGVVVTIDDAPDASVGSLNRVLDRDLQDIVNTLWREGAVGLAINEQRLTGTTAIRAAGEAILVNYQPLNRPYVITSVGGLQATAGGSGLNGLLTSLSTDYGLVTDVHSADVALPAGDLRGSRYASTSATDGGEVGQ